MSAARRSFQFDPFRDSVAVLKSSQFMYFTFQSFSSSPISKARESCEASVNLKLEGVRLDTNPACVVVKCFLAISLFISGIYGNEGTWLHLINVLYIFTVYFDGRDIAVDRVGRVSDDELWNDNKHCT